jgi:hypothetical protein
MPDVAMQQIRHRLSCFRGRYREICVRGRLTYSWLTKFATGERPRPGFELMDRLLTTLDAMEREVGGDRRHRKRVPRRNARSTSRRKR